MREQRVITIAEDYEEFDTYLKNSNHKNILLVCGASIKQSRINSYFKMLEDKTEIKIVRFSDFKPNPTYDSVVRGVDCFHENGCDMVIAVGGGSAIDVAKSIKLFANMDRSKNYLEQKIIPNDIEFVAVPTTAGTGSEATRFAVIYNQGEKQSITDESCIPSVVLFDAELLKTLPEYQKKSTMMDAMCHAIEAFWSVNSNEESQEYSKKTIKTILEYKDSYLKNEDVGNTKMLQAANLAGRAINIAQTTAGHAMCYKLTSLYGISHGHAVALCMSKLWPYMLKHTDKCIDARGEQYLKTVYNKLAEAFGCENAEEAVEKYNCILKKLELEIPNAKELDYDVLKTSVNPVRLKNNPVRLDDETINNLYHQILNKEREDYICK